MSVAPQHVVVRDTETGSTCGGNRRRESFSAVDVSDRRILVSFLPTNRLIIARSQIMRFSPFRPVRRRVFYYRIRKTKQPVNIENKRLIFYHVPTRFVKHTSRFHNRANTVETKRSREQLVAVIHVSHLVKLWAYRVVCRQTENNTNVFSSKNLTTIVFHLIQHRSFSVCVYDRDEDDRSKTYKVLLRDFQMGRPDRSHVVLLGVLLKFSGRAAL